METDKHTHHTVQMNWFSGFFITLALVVSGIVIFTIKGFGSMFKPEAITLLWPFCVLFFISAWILLLKIYQSETKGVSAFEIAVKFIALVLFVAMTSNIIASSQAVQEALNPF